MEEENPPLLPKHGYYPNPGDAKANDDDIVIDPTTAIVPFSREPKYVVIVPKDQIFRVPPLENDHIMKEYQSQLQNRPKTPAYCSRIAYLLIILLVIALIALSACLLFYLVAKPDVPHLTIDSIVATRPDFAITLKAQNPSPTMDLLHFYDQGGKVDLRYEKTVIASVDPPVFNIGHKHTTEIKLTLQGLKNVFPDEVEDSLKGSNDVIDLKLLAEIPVKLGFGAFQMRNKGLKLECNAKVRTLGKGTQIMSQNCDAKLVPNL